MTMASAERDASTCMEANYEWSSAKMGAKYLFKGGNKKKIYNVLHNCYGWYYNSLGNRKWLKSRDAWS